jgi:hypothetical protein
MSKIDWQAYRDGSLSQEDVDFAETQLLTDPTARRELDGLSKFVGAVKASGKSMDIPLSRLEKLIPGPKERSPNRWVWGALAAAALIPVAFLLRPTSEDSAGEFGLTTKDPVAAAQWLQPKFAFHVPALSLGPDAPLEFVHHGGNSSCCLDYAFRGNVYHVNLLRKGTDFARSGRHVRLSSGIEATVGRSISWTQGGWDLHVVGPVPADRLEVASRASMQLQSGI